MNYKMIATDMDGTLLNDDILVSKENEISIKKAQEHGIVFTLASGRPTPAMWEYARQLEMPKYGGYIVSYNGGEIWDCKENKCIYRKGMEKEDIIELYRFAKKEEISFLTYNDNTIYVSEINEYTIVESQLTKLEIKEIPTEADLLKLDFNKITKCMLLTDAENAKIKEIKLKHKYGNKYFIAISKPIFIEVLNKETDKGIALDHLMNILKIKREETIIVGDSYNDIPMLDIAGMAVVTDNAHNDIKEYADIITTSNNEHALATIINKYILS